jgi:DNA-binding CsgD family transcriptional regulator/exonuclease VII small subunit
MLARRRLVACRRGVFDAAQHVARASVVGREPELEAIRSFLELEPSGGRTLVLEGEAGIGKTTLWREAARIASADGCRVLQTRPSSAEAGFVFSGLGDLLGDRLDGLGPELPGPQFAALEVALLRRVTDEPADPHVIAAAVLGALRGLATKSPVIVAVDDVQWLDRETTGALTYAFRRLDEHPVRLVASLRLDPALPPSELLESVPPDRATRITVGPLSPGALHAAFRIHLDRSLPRPLLLRIHQLAGGNPFYALELARSLPDDPGPELALPSRLERLTRERLQRLAVPVRHILEPAALLTNPTATVLERLSDDPGVAGTHLDEAVAAGVIEIDGGRIRFTHPLLAEGMGAMIGPRRRHELHRRLAEVVHDPEERARHLALSTEAPDAEVAAALDEAARHSRARGAPDAAAELAELARRLTPSDEAQTLRGRGLEAAQYHFDAGDAARATSVLREIIESSPPGPDRAHLLYRLAGMSWMNLVDGVGDAARRALEEAGDDLELRSGIHDALAWVAFYLADLDAASEHATASAECATDAALPATRADALATLGFVEFVRGRPSERLMSEAIELQDEMMATRSWTESSVYTTPRSILGLELMWSGRLDEARAVLQQELALYDKQAMYTVRQEALCYLSETESRAGRWELAVGYAADAMETVVESGQTATQSHVVLFARSLAAAYLGQVAEARRWAADGVRLATANDDPFYGSSNRAVLGFLDVSLSNFEQAVTHLEPVVAYLERMGAAEPAIIPCAPDLVEALVSVGRPDEAEPHVERLEEQGRALDRPWAIAAAARCRGSIAVARRDLDGAEAALEAALDVHGRADQPFELARTLLVLGEVRRRAQRRRVARETLQRALAIFDDLGAPLWAERGRTQLASIGGRAPAGDELTPSERRIAELVAEGKTNKEVAAILVLAERTVESALTQIYRKLEIRSRTELARRLAAGD